jgi:hypothetical protein
MIKVILALQHGEIPATRGVKAAMTSKNGGVSEEQIVQKTTVWATQSKGSQGCQ